MSKENENRIYDDYLTFRKDLITSENESSKNLDQAVITIASGAIGLSVAFIEKLSARPPIQPLWLELSWSSLTLSLGLVLISFYTSKRSYTRHTKIWDEIYEATRQKKSIADINKRNVWKIVTECLNFSAPFLLVLGISCLLWFSFVNLQHLRPLQPQTNTANQFTV